MSCISPCRRRARQGEAMFAGIDCRARYRVTNIRRRACRHIVLKPIGAHHRPLRSTSHSFSSMCGGEDAAARFIDPLSTAVPDCRHGPKRHQRDPRASRQHRLGHGVQLLRMNADSERAIVQMISAPLRAPIRWPMSPPAPAPIWISPRKACARRQGSHICRARALMSWGSTGP